MAALNGKLSIIFFFFSHIYNLGGIINSMEKELICMYDEKGEDLDKILFDIYLSLVKDYLKQECEITSI